MIHILKHGLSYCRMSGVPAQWPAGNTWISFEDNWSTHATCPSCRELATLDPEATRDLTLADAAVGGPGLATRAS